MRGLPLFMCLAATLVAAPPTSTRLTQIRVPLWMESKSPAEGDLSSRDFRATLDGAPAPNAALRQEAAAGKQSTAQIRQLTSELENIFHWREMYLNNILRRYKEVTEQYRALSSVLDSRHDRAAVPLGGTEISRIQNTIVLAEDDLKQIQTPNAQALRLQKKLPVK